ncbi:MAG: alpha/beta fold hydrolase [Cytophagaceae bacterium]|nr:alpha/beta fold hydrolase [Cytophagaceae bacterium]MDW8456976.1 alpha/beta fold hydrolase [Cytophagaceae bacterium]
MKLHYKELGQDGKPSIVILHGVFGSSDNWLSVGKVLSMHYKVYLLDARNHGASPHSNEFNYLVMAGDVAEFIEDKQITKPVLIGHSMGGKTVMKFNEHYPHVALKNVIVDISPRYYPPHHQKILQGLNAIPLDTLLDRRQADDILKNYEPSESVRQFLLKNLVRTENGFVWRINLKVISEKINNVGEANIPSKRIDTRTLFIKGALSDYITENDETMIKNIFSNCEIVTIADAGHWIHAEKPQDFLNVVRKFLNEF